MLFTNRINQEAFDFGYYFETVLIFFLAHEMRHFFQYDYLGLEAFKRLNNFEKWTSKNKTKEQHYIDSNIENDANFFAYFFIKDHELQGDHLVFNNYLFKDMEIFRKEYFPLIPHNVNNGYNAYKIIKKTKKIHLSLIAAFAIIFLCVYIYIL